MKTASFTTTGFFADMAWILGWTLPKPAAASELKKLATLVGGVAPDLLQFYREHDGLGQSFSGLFAAKDVVKAARRRVRKRDLLVLHEDGIRTFALDLGNGAFVTLAQDSADIWDEYKKFPVAIVSIVSYVGKPSARRVMDDPRSAATRVWRAVEASAALLGEPKTLPKGATSQAVSQLENGAGFALPEIVRQILTAHNGAASESILFSVEQSANELAYVKRLGWQQMLPVARGGGNWFALLGQTGEILRVDGEGGRSVVASNLAEYLALIAPWAPGR